MHLLNFAFIVYIDHAVDVHFDLIDIFSAAVSCFYGQCIQISSWLLGYPVDYNSSDFSLKEHQNFIERYFKMSQVEP